MRKTPPHRPSRLHARLLLPALFLSFLFLPLMDSIFGFAPKVALNEKRALAPVPRLSGEGESLETYPGRFEQYYDDNFGFRGFLTYWHNYIRMFWFRSSPTDRVILGSDGWLFFGENAARMSYQRLVTLTEGDCAHWQRSLRLVTGWLHEQGILFVIMVPPNKSTVYSEHMPDSIRPREGPPLIDQFIECSSGAGVEVLDFRDEMGEAKGDFPLYPRTDTHWGPAGAHLAYRKLMKTLASRSPGFDAGPLSSIRLGDEEDYTGDLAFMAGLENLTEKRPRVLVEGEPEAPVVTEGLIRFGGSYTLETGRPDLPSAVLFRDSYGVELIPFLAPHFRRLRTIWDYRFNREVIEEEKPDIVILEIIERYLTRGPDVLGRYSALMAAFEGTHAATDLSRAVGTNEADGSSFFGSVRSARGGVTPPGWLVFGPYRRLDPGSYRATFRMRAGGEESGPLARIEVTAGKGEQNLAQRTVRLEEFGGARAWTGFDLTFALQERARDVEYRVEYFGKGDLDVDTVQLRGEALP